MKRIGNIWSKIVDIDNIILAHKNASRGKGFYSDVKLVNSNPEYYLQQIQQSLITGTFTTSPYEVEDRFDGRKLRTIHKLPYYPDRIVQHALLNIIGPILVRSFIRDTFQSIPGRGTGDAARRVKRAVCSTAPPKYALKLDIHKYYPSVCNSILKQAVRSKIKCANTIGLLDNIIDSTSGLPIGNYTSQHLGNLYLSDFDWWVKQHIKPQAYFRYCDDLVILHSSREELFIIKQSVEHRLAELHLSIKDSWTLRDIELDGVDFVGYVFRPKCIKVRNGIAQNLRKVCKRLVRRPKLHTQDLSALMAYKGWTMQAKANRLWTRHVTTRLRAKLYNQLGVVC